MTTTFEDLVVFKRALELMKGVYQVTESFPSSERYGLASQLRRASIGILSNLAEGQGRLTDGEWRQALSHARGSLLEIEAEVIAAKELQFLSEDDHARIRELCRRTARPLAGLISYVRKQEEKKRSPTRRSASSTVHRPPSTGPEIRK
jgi:four helix bundle protein